MMDWVTPCPMEQTGFSHVVLWFPWSSDCQGTWEQGLDGDELLEHSLFWKNVAGAQSF